MKLPAATLLGAVLLVARGAAADLGRDAARVAESLRGRGATVVRLPARFVEQDRLAAIAVPGPAAPEAPAGCTAVVVVGSRSLDFWAGPLEAVVTSRAGNEPEPRPSRTPGGADEVGRVRASAGVAVVSRCGDDRAALSRVAIETRSPRGAVEILVVRSREALPAATELFPERDNGPSAPRGDPGGAIEPGPVDERVAAAERRAVAGGASTVRRFTHRASAEGTGTVVLALDEGCHRLTLMAAIPKIVPRRATDLDAMARDPIGGRTLGRDRSEAPDALLETCLGDAGPVEITFAGASGPVDVQIVDGVWAVPAHVPAELGARTRAGFAWALWRRRAPAFDDDPVFRSLGVAGATSFAVPVEPGRCYVAALAIVRGESRGTRLTADLAERSLRDEALAGDTGAAVALCSQTDSVVRFAVEVRGGSPWWSFALWDAGSAPR